VSRLIDLSSDTATQPTPAMRRFMCAAPVGDEQRGEDPTVRLLEETVAELLGREAAVFLPSGTMCNIVAYFVHGEPGDEVILHRDTHPVYSETGGPAVHARVSLAWLEGARGQFSGADVAAAIRTRQPWKPRSRLLSVENTSNRGGGSIWPLARIEEVCTVAHEHGLVAHLDGARLLNAVVATGVSAASYCAPFDSAWIDLSKGLGCPVGAALAGSGDFVREARRAKHLFGGAMRQAGIIAAAGVYALRHHVERLAEDHALAKDLAAALREVPGIVLDEPETNIVLFDVPAPLTAADVLERALTAGVRFSEVGPRRLRAVTHLDVQPPDVELAARAVGAALAG